MRDLLIITPTRGRPGNAQRLADAVAATCTADTDLALAVDDDDVSYNGRLKWPSGLTYLPDRVRVVRGPRKSCPAWSNEIAAEYAGKYRAFASLGDDHLPRTPGWDTSMLAALEQIGGTGIVYGDDIGQGKDLPTAPVISADIVRALGWMFLPAAQHLFCDNVWLDLGREAGCLAYLPGVVIEHLHYSRGAAPFDTTYAESTAVSWQHDQAAYQTWRRDHMAADVAKIRSLKEAAA